LDAASFETVSVSTQPVPPRYVDVELIGHGGMGTIYSARDRDLRRKVAIKVLDEHVARDPETRRRFMREARAAARLSGMDHIITIFDVGEWNDRPFIVMEFLPGGTLAQRMREGRPDRQEVLRWLEQAAGALDCAHREGVIHRDVKPANLLLDRRGHLHVADFGIARIADETTGMTMAGTILGTAGYLSPEQAHGEKATELSDVYSLAVVAYELLTGGRPFERGSATAEAAAHAHEPVPPASKRGVGIPPEVDAVFDRALAKDPSQRYRTASDFVRALRAAFELPGETRALSPTIPAEDARPVRRRPSHALPVLAALVLAALAVAGVVAAALLAGGDEDPPATTRRAQQQQPQAQQPQRQTVRITQPTTVVTTVIQTQPSPAAPPAPPAATQPASELSIAEAVELTDQATGLIRQGNYAAALPLALKALERLQGTGETYEGYANYDVGRSLAELGRCREALPYLNRREQLLGRHPDVTAAKRKCGA
jgi:eukaryotic-like serine/threonine-protein kinase